MCRQVDRAEGSFAGLGLEFEQAFVLTDDRADDPETEFGGFASFPRNPGGVKGPPDEVGIGASSGVAHGDTGVSSGLQPGPTLGEGLVDGERFDVNLELTALTAEGVHGIGAQVEEQLVELNRVRFDARRVGGDDGGPLDGGGHAGADELQAALQVGLGIDRTPLLPDMQGEVGHLVDQRAGATNGPEKVIQVLEGMGEGIGFLADQVGKGPHGTEDIAKLVDQVGCQLRIGLEGGALGDMEAVGRAVGADL